MNERHLPKDGAWSADEESARMLLQSVQDYAIYLMDEEGRIRTWNTGAEIIKGYRAEEIIGQHFSIFYTPEDRAAAEPERELLAAVDGRVENEAWRVRKNGERFWANVVVTPLRDHSGALLGFAKVTRDLTERRKREEDRLRLMRAEEALRVRDEFFSNASRSLDNTLVSIRVHLNALKSTVDTMSGNQSSAAAKLQLLEWGLDRLSRSVQDVLETATAASVKLAAELKAK